MDLQNIKPNSRSVDIKHPVTQERIGLTISLRPVADPVVKAAKRKQIDARLSGRGRHKVTAVQLEQSAIEVLVAAISGWTFGTAEDGTACTFGGEVLEYNDINVRKLLKHDWIREQLDEELGDEAAFF